MKIHVVKQGDTFTLIAAKHNTTVEHLQQLNPQLSSIDQLEIGMKVRVPSGKPSMHMHHHVVKEGDTLYKLAQTWGYTVEQLIEANPQLQDPDHLVVGELVYIPRPHTKPAVPTIEATYEQLPSPVPVNAQLYPGLEEPTIAQEVAVSATLPWVQPQQHYPHSHPHLPFFPYPPYYPPFFPPHHHHHHHPHANCPWGPNCPMHSQWWQSHHPEPIGGPRVTTSSTVEEEAESYEYDSSIPMGDVTISGLSSASTGRKGAKVKLHHPAQPPSNKRKTGQHGQLLHS